MSETTNEYGLRCRKCGQTGLLSITLSRTAGWSFATAGFIGLAVSRTALASSVIRCNSCRSTDVEVTRPSPTAG
jgi:hypothetical protein